MQKQAIIMDCGSGYSKLGYAGNVQPSFIIPTVLSHSGGSRPPRGLEDLGFCAGEDALAACAIGACDPVYPVRHGLVDNWDHMEKFWQYCIFQQLRVDPSDHAFVLTEPPLNPPEAREALAEVMFEGFGVSGLYIGVQAVLALYASWAFLGKRAKATATAGEHMRDPGEAPLTGCVVDVGEGTTHVVPVVDGYVLGGSAASMPLAGREVSAMVQHMMRTRGEPVPPDMSIEVARRVKEEHCYVCADMQKEFGRYDANPEKYFRSLGVKNGRTNTSLQLDIGFERFLAPELLFNPSMAPTTVMGTTGAGGWNVPLSQLVDNAIQSCPIDTRRALYGNIVLSGGGTMFKNFGRRLGAELHTITGARLKLGATALDIQVHSHPLQRYAVWFGGSVLSCDTEFPRLLHTRADYEEHGPRGSKSYTQSFTVRPRIVRPRVLSLAHWNI